MLDVDDHNDAGIAGGSETIRPDGLAVTILVGGPVGARAGEVPKTSL
jgi:hypothetical protein